jgi:MinD-like ATPase involved in chromosome partitioning or flagellar assembly
MAKVVLATGVEQLDRDIASEMEMNGVEVAGECYYLEGILPCCIQKQADTVIVSPELSGTSSIDEVIIALRMSPLNIRVILLPGPEDMDDPGDLVGSVIGAGVYDIVFSAPSSAGSTVSAKEVVRRVLTPATYAEAEGLLASGLGVFHRKLSIMQDREQRAIGDALAAKVNVLEDASAPTRAKKRVKRFRNIDLPKFMRGMIERISNLHRNTEEESLAGIQESAGELTWKAEEWNSQREKSEQKKQNSALEVRSTASKDVALPMAKEKVLDAIPVKKAKENLSLSVSTEKTEDETAWEAPVKKALEVDSWNWFAEEGPTSEENSIESPGCWAAPDESCLENHHRNLALECRPGIPEVRRKQDTKIGSLLQGRRTATERGNLRYLPHQLVAVWSPDGWAKSYTAFNLAALAVNMGFDSALINYDVHCPELDIWFGVKQTDIGGFQENSAGVMTFGDCFRPELVSRFLKKSAWGIKYLPAGNKLGNICTPDFETEVMEQMLKIVYQRNTEGKPAITIVDAGRSYKYVSTMAALRQAAIVLIPTDGSPVIAEAAKQQIEELHRLGHNPRFIEVLFKTPGRQGTHICQERCSVAFDWNTFLIDRTAMKPQCLRVDGRRSWECVLNQLMPRHG